MEIETMKELVAFLNENSVLYYNGGTPVSDKEFDEKYDLLVQKESETGIILPDSPTQRVGTSIPSGAKKETHKYPCLSLNKTKSIPDLIRWLNGKTGYLTPKLDGMTVQVTYRNGRLEKCITRGNGIVGEILATAKYLGGLPANIPYLGELVVRGEALVSMEEFQRINREILEETRDSSQLYKNPRNLVSGIIRSEKAIRGRKVCVRVFQLVYADVPFQLQMERFEFLANQGFEVNYGIVVTENTLGDSVEKTSDCLKTTFPYATDGLVLTYQDVAYGESLGTTGKFPRGSIAFKWKDETEDTILRDVFWSASRTGALNPVAVFDPVELEGTTVTRASLHNVSVLRALKVGIGDTISVYKANMIIPQVYENKTESDSLLLPSACPVCGGPTSIECGKEAEVLVCKNADCPAKKIGAFERFCCRDAMNIEGVSEATLETFIQAGFLHSFLDLYHLDQYKQEIIGMEGFGEKSWENLWTSIQNSRHVGLDAFLYAQGITNIGRDVSKRIAEHCGSAGLAYITEETLPEFSFLGPITYASFADWCLNLWGDEKKKDMFGRLVKELEILVVGKSAGKLTGMTFVITGNLHCVKNRDALVHLIEEEGGKVSDSVSAKTTALINNDVASSSSKNEKAKKLGVPIWSEESFLREHLDIPC